MMDLRRRRSQARERNPRSLAVGGEVHLLRYVPGASPIHRLWAGTKLLCLAAMSIAMVSKPEWPTLAIGWASVLLAFALSRVPRTALPRPPKWFLVGILVTGMFAIGSGGPPTVHVAGQDLGLGGLFEWARFTMLGLLVLVLATLIGWTTPLAEFPGALDRLYAPLRLVRLPVDELVMAVALAARCVPLLIDEMRILGAARRLRDPIVPHGLRERVGALQDLLVTALVAALRRARDLAEALDARGGVRLGTRTPVRLGAVDAVAVLGTIAAIVAITIS